MATPTSEDRGANDPQTADGAILEEVRSSDLSDEDEEDERPDPVRLSILAGILVVLVGFWVWTILHPPPRKAQFYTDIPGINLDACTAAQRQQILIEANQMPCDCGSDTCHYSVAECRHAENTTCDVSLRLAGKIVKRVTGKDPVYTMSMPPPMTGPGGSGAPQAAPARPGPAAPPGGSAGAPTGSGSAARPAGSGSAAAPTGSGSAKAPTVPAGSGPAPAGAGSAAAPAGSGGK